MNRPPTRRLAYPLVAAALLAGCTSTGSTTTLPDRSTPASSIPAAPSPAVPSPTVPSLAVPSPTVPSPAAPAPAPATSVPATVGPAGCPSTGVRLRLDGGDAAMGLRVLGISLENCGASTYRLNGYPAVRALDDSRAALPVRVLQGVTDITISIPDRMGRPQPVTLRPGERATAVVVWRNTYDDITHPPVDVSYLDVAPAAGRPAQLLVREGGLDLGSTGRLGVSPWRRSPTTAAPEPSRAPAPPAATVRPPLP